MGELIDVPTPSGPAEAYLTGESGRPGVLFFTDAFGVRPRTQEMADRIASWGYAVLVPNLFHRDGMVAELGPTVDLRDPEQSKAFFAGAFGRVRGYSAEVSGPDTQAWLDALGRHAGRPFGVTGYCMGARLAVRAACAHPDDIVACGGWHGGGLATEEPDSPHLQLGRARAEFAFGHADHDRSMGPEAVDRLDAALAAAGLTFTSEIFEGVAHGYTMADTAAYDESAAERHFAVLEALLERRLGASGSA